MKLYNLIVNAMMATVFSTSVHAATHSPQSEQLMASMLPDFIPHDSKLSYALDHEFYDTPVHLIDENNQMIRFQHQISPSHHYQVVPEGNARVSYKNIWFFSESGTIQHFDGKNDLSKCVAQNPCSNIEQKSIDQINALKPAANLWFNKGNYTLPTLTKVGGESKILRLYNKQVIMGRSPDFDHIARKNERPRFLGTLAWSGYTDHEGNNGEVYSVRILTKDNFFEASNGYKISTNIYATGKAIVKDAELISRDLIDVEQNEQAVYSAIFSEYAEVNDTTMYVNAKLSTGIFAGKATVSQSNIDSSGQSAIGVYLFDRSSSKDKMTNYTNFFSQLDITASGALASGIISNGDNIAFSLSSITTDSSFYSLGISSLEGINLNAGSKFDIKSDLIATGIETASCIFTSDASFVNVTAPMGLVLSLTQPELVNESVPPSRCKLNEEEAQDCSYSEELSSPAPMQMAKLKQRLNNLAATLNHK